MMIQSHSKIANFKRQANLFLVVYEWEPSSKDAQIFPYRINIYVDYVVMTDDSALGVGIWNYVTTKIGIQSFQWC
jgi:hypothetical protein